MVFKSMRDSPSGTASTWAFNMRARYVSKIIPCISREASDRPLGLFGSGRSRPGGARTRTGPGSGDAWRGAGPGGGCSAFLETGTPRNVLFYQSLGFQVVDEQRAPDGGPIIWFMQTPRLQGQVAQRLRTAPEPVTWARSQGLKPLAF